MPAEHKIISGSATGSTCAGLARRFAMEKRVLVLMTSAFILACGSIAARAQQSPGGPIIQPPALPPTTQQPPNQEAPGMMGQGGMMGRGMMGQADTMSPGMMGQ